MLTILALYPTFQISDKSIKKSYSGVHTHKNVQKYLKCLDIRM